MRLLPENNSFFDDFDKHTELIVSSAEMLQTMLRPEAAPPSDQAAHIKALEAEGDVIVHRVVVGLRRTFITPLDRDDTYTLISRLDDVLDQIESAAYRLALYRLPAADRHLDALVGIVGRAAAVTRQAVADLRDKSHHDQALERCVEINRLENEADAALRLALAELFADGVDPILLIKRKEIYETLEETTDRCEDVADAIENLLLDS